MQKLLKLIIIASLFLSIGMRRAQMVKKPYSTMTVNFKIVSYYSLNPVVWGTYKLSRETIFKIDKKTKKQIKISKTSNKYLKESLLFERNKLFIIKNELNQKSKGKLLVKSFPYKLSKKSLVVEIFKNKDDYFDLSYSKIKKALSNINDLSGLKYQSSDYLYVGKMNCRKKFKGYECSTNITLSLI